MWYYISFAAKSGFLGGVFIEADNAEAAVELSKNLEISPRYETGIEVLVVAFDDYIDEIPAKYRNVLVSKKVLIEEFDFATLGELRKKSGVVN